MNQDPVTIDRIDWLKVFPWLHLLRSSRMGFRFRVLLPAVLLIGFFSLRGLTVDSWPDFGPRVSRTYFRWDEFAWLPGWTLYAPLGLVLPALSGLGGAVVALVNAVIVMFAGVAIGRSTASDFCAHERVGAISALSFSASQWKAQLVSTALMLAILGILQLPLMLIRWLPASASSLHIVTVILWPVIYVLAVLTVVASVVCITGWTLSIGAIATDQCSGSDALSRGINYVLSHKLVTAGYLVVVSLTSAITLMLAQKIFLAAEMTLRGRMPVLMSAPGGNSTTGRLSFLSQGIVNVLPYAVHFGTFLAGVTMMYILLRKAEDAVQLTEMDGAAERPGRSSATD